MDALEQNREKINEIDRKMAELFCARMEAVKEVALYKKARGLQIFDRERENKLTEKNAAYVEDAVVRSYYVQFLRGTMELSKQYQKRLLDGLSVALTGVEGAFAHVAACRIFPTAQFSFYKDFPSAYESVEQGVCDLCVLPIENSYAGEVTPVTDLIFSGSLHINGVYDLEICHNLLGKKGARLSEIQTVVSHPQALAQCEGYIKKHGYRVVHQANTAVAAKSVAEGEDKTVAAIASAETAALYGLEILDHDIHESGSNTTRFAVFSRTKNSSPQGDSRFIMVFTARNEAGSLANAIRIIGDFGFNMQVLRSRPVKEEPWQYYFYVEIEGSPDTKEAKEMLKALSAQCERVKIVGSFSGDKKL